MQKDITAAKGEQRTMCDACGRADLAASRAVWTEDESSFCPECAPSTSPDNIQPDTAKRKALADDPRVAALMDCQFMAGVTAGWNAAHAPEPNEKLAAISKAYEGRIKPLLESHPTPQSGNG